MNTQAWRRLAPAINLTEGARKRISIAPVSIDIAEDSPQCLQIPAAGINTNTRVYGNLHWVDQAGYGEFPLNTDVWQWDAWIKYASLENSVNDRLHLFQKSTGLNRYIKISITNAGYPELQLLINAVPIVLTGTVKVPAGDWHHVAVLYSRVGIIRTVTFYVDGVVTEGVPLSDDPPDDDASSVPIIGASLETTPNAEFCIDEIRIWSVIQDAEYFHGRNPNVYIDEVNTDDDRLVKGLWGYWKFTEADKPFYNHVENLVDIALKKYTFDSSNGTYDVLIDGYPHTYSHESIFVGRVPLASIAQNFSIKYPVEQPVGANYSLIVSWIDDNDVTQRRALWLTDGYIGDTIAIYQGERIVYTNAYLDLYNDLYERTTDITDTLTLELSCIENYADLAGNKTTPTAIAVSASIYAALPLALPATFDSTRTDY